MEKFDNKGKIKVISNYEFFESYLCEAIFREFKQFELIITENFHIFSNPTE